MATSVKPVGVCFCCGVEKRPHESRPGLEFIKLSHRKGLKEIISKYSGLLVDELDEQDGGCMCRGCKRRLETLHKKAEDFRKKCEQTRASRRRTAKIPDNRLSKLTQPAISTSASANSLYRVIYVPGQSQPVVASQPPSRVTPILPCPQDERKTESRSTSPPVQKKKKKSLDTVVEGLTRTREHTYAVKRKQLVKKQLISVQKTADELRKKCEQTGASQPVKRTAESLLDNPSKKSRPDISATDNSSTKHNAMGLGTQCRVVFVSGRPVVVSAPSSRLTSILPVPLPGDERNIKSATVSSRKDKVFSSLNDCQLLRRVSSLDPFSNDKEWAAVARSISTPTFNITAGRAKERVELLMKYHVCEEKKSRKKQGTEEDVNELKRLLTECVQLRNESVSAKPLTKEKRFTSILPRPGDERNTKSASASSRKEKVVFSSLNDCQLLKHVVSLDPFSNGKEWAAVARSISTPTFSITTRRAKQRFKLLMKYHVCEEKDSKKKPGTEKDVNELKRLLTECVQLRNKSVSAKERVLQDGKKAASKSVKRKNDPPTKKENPKNRKTDKGNVVESYLMEKLLFEEQKREVKKEEKKVQIEKELTNSPVQEKRKESLDSVVEGLTFIGEHMYAADPSSKETKPSTIADQLHSTEAPLQESNAATLLLDIKQEPKYSTLADQLHPTEAPLKETNAATPLLDIKREPEHSTIADQLHPTEAPLKETNAATPLLDIKQEPEHSTLADQLHPTEAPLKESNAATPLLDIKQEPQETLIYHQLNSS